MRPLYSPAIFSALPRKQRGAALMVMLVIMVIGSATILVNSLNSSAITLDRQEKTAAALAQAKDALIGFATKVALDRTCTGSNCARPGDLPCPDTNNDGDAEGSCGNAVGSTGQSNRLGRLPWKTLGLPDLRDGSGERLWYAVSNNFKNNTRSTSLLNSDTPGSITVRNSNGSILHNGLAANGTGAVAIIIAPGEVLRRTDQATPQDRSAAGINLPENYLDIANLEDNAAFADNSENGFIQGIIKDGNNSAILNDQLLVITQDNVMQTIQKRVAGEVKQCLIAYAALNNNRYPWAARVDETLPIYYDNNNELFGRIPDDLARTRSSSGDTMINGWPPTCNTHAGNVSAAWWTNWKELVFYAVADAYKPALSGTPFTPCSAAGACLKVNPIPTSADVKFVVIVAGRTLAGQARSTSNNKRTPSNYLEDINSAGGVEFIQQQPSAIFNDTLVFQ